MTEESYTPTTGEVRAVWREWNGYGGLIDRTCPEPATRAGMVAEFDRWLAGVKADAWDEAVGAAGNHIFSGHPGDLPNPYRQEAYL